MIIRGCRNQPDDGVVSLFVVSRDLKVWRDIDVKYWELYDAIANGSEVYLIEYLYEVIERQLISRM